MGCRLEIYTNKDTADDIIKIARSFNIDAQVIGRVERCDKKELLIIIKDEEIVY
jgi:phosphoribosylformylglycinamidine cyclo-ligase